MNFSLVTVVIMIHNYKVVVSGKYTKGTKRVLFLQFIGKGFLIEEKN